MYFGSVKFFRHLILAVFFGWMGVATVLAVFFGIKCHNLEKKTDSSSENAKQTTSVQEYISKMSAAGFSDEEIIEYLIYRDANSGINENYSYIYEENVTENAVSEVPTETSAEMTSVSVLPVQTLPPVTDSSQITLPTAEVTTAAAVTEESIPLPQNDYSALFPELRAERSLQTTVPTEKTVFLAFEDGPSYNTSDILTILSRQGVKATFFMSAGKTSDCAERMKEVAAAGHTIGVHSFSHDPSYIYSSVENYLTDFYDTYKMIYDATGYKPLVYSLPNSESIPEQLKTEIIAEMNRRGFTLCTFNAESGDRTSPQWQNIYDSTLSAVHSNTNSGKASTVHMHDSADDYTTVITAEDIITDLKAEGYIFSAFDNSVTI